MASSTSCPACNAEKERSKTYCLICEDALKTIAAEGDDDLFEVGEDVNPLNSQAGFRTDTTVCVTLPESNLVTPEGSQENSRTAAVMHSTIRRVLQFEDTSEKTVKGDSSVNISHVCPACNGEKDRSKKVCRTCEEAFDSIALEGMDDDDDMLEDESMKGNLGIAMSQKATAQRPLKISDNTGAESNGKNDDSSERLVLTIQIQSPRALDLYQRYVAAQESGEVLEIRSQGSISSAHAISSPCRITGVCLKHGENSYPPSNNIQHSEAVRSGASSTTTCTNTATNPKSPSIPSDQKSESVLTCSDCGAPTDTTWKRRCSACYAQNMSKLEESGNGSTCQMCSKQLDETGKRYCSVCHAAKLRDQRRELADSFKRKSAPNSPTDEAKRSRVP